MEDGYIGREITVDEDLVEKALIKIDGIYWTINNRGTPIKNIITSAEIQQVMEKQMRKHFYLLEASLLLQKC